MKARQKLREILRIEGLAQLGWTLVMILGGLATGCLFAGLPVYAWARVRLLRIQLVASGIPLVSGNLSAGILYALGLVGGTGVALAGAAGGGLLGLRLGAPSMGRALGLALALGLYAALLRPLARLPLILLDARRDDAALEALEASIRLSSRGGLDLPTLSMALSLAPLVLLILLPEGWPPLSALAVVSPWLGMTLCSALRVAEYSEAEPKEAVAHGGLPRGLPTLTGLAATLAVALCLTVFVPAPMRLEGAAPEAVEMRELPVGLGGEGVELREAEGGVLVLRRDGGGAGSVRSQGAPTSDSVEVERLPEGRGHRIHVATERGYEFFEVDPRGVRRDDGPVARASALVGGAGALLLFLSLLASTLTIRFPLGSAILHPAEQTGWAARGAMILTAALLAASLAQIVRALL